MQMTSHGIPCNLPVRYRPNMKVRSIEHRKLKSQNPYKKFSELTRYVDGLEQTIICPVGTKEYRKALLAGYKITSEWERGKIQ